MRLDLWRLILAFHTQDQPKLVHAIYFEGKLENAGEISAFFLASWRLFLFKATLRLSSSSLYSKRWSFPCWFYNNLLSAVQLFHIHLGFPVEGGVDPWGHALPRCYRDLGLPREGRNSQKLFSLASRSTLSSRTNSFQKLAYSPSNPAYSTPGSVCSDLKHNATPVSVFVYFYWHHCCASGFGVLYRGAIVIHNINRPKSHLNLLSHLHLSTSSLMEGDGEKQSLGT